MHRSADGRPAAPAPFPASPARFSRPVRRIPCWVLIQRRRTLGRRCVRLVSIETLRNNFFGSKRCCRIDFVAACMHASTTIPCLSNCLAYPQEMLLQTT